MVPLYIILMMDTIFSIVLWTSVFIDNEKDDAVHSRCAVCNPGRAGIVLLTCSTLYLETLHLYGII